MQNQQKITILHIILGGILFPIFSFFLPKVLADLGFNNQSVGELFSIAQLASILPAIYFIYFGLNKKTVYFNLFIIATSLFLTDAFSSNYFLVMASLIAWSFSMTVIWGVFDQITFDKMPKDYTKIKAISTISFLPILVIMGEFYNPSMVIYSMIFGGFSLAILAYLIITKEDNFGENNLKIELKMITKHKFFWFEILIHTSAVGVLFAFLTIYLADEGMSMKEISYTYFPLIIAEAAMFYAMPKLFKNKSTDFIINISVLMTSLRFFILFFFPQNFILVMLSQALHAFSMSSWHSGKMHKISEKFPSNQTQMGQQLYLAGWGIGLASGAFLGGVFYSKMMFFVTGAVLAIYILVKKIMMKNISPETCA